MNCLLQKEKVKVYIDEKYHHATDPSIRPKSNADGGQAGSNAAAATSNDDGTAAVASKASTLVRKDNANQNEPKSSGDVEEQSYGKDIKDIPRYVRCLEPLGLALLWSA